MLSFKLFIEETTYKKHIIGTEKPAGDDSLYHLHFSDKKSKKSGHKYTVTTQNKAGGLKHHFHTDKIEHAKHEHETQLKNGNNSTIREN